MKKFRYISAIILIFTSCVEQFDISDELPDNIAESILVVEATITDAIEVQKVFLKRASNLGQVNLQEYDYNPNLREFPVEDLTNYEENAAVTIVDDMGIRFDFSESEPGTYLSNSPFAVEIGSEYQLQVTTSINEDIRSDFRNVPGKSQITNLYAERIVNDSGIEGMAIYADGDDSSGIADHFRYVYEETYKIIAPKWTDKEINVIFEGNLINETPILEVVDRPQEEQTCYGTANSTDIILESTINLEFPEVKRKLVRFIDRDNAILTHRYSILVKQLVQSQSSYQYYERLRSFTKSESVFSEIQPGFLEGNLKSSAGTPVIGYFEVSSVSEKRIFFDYEDFFQGEELPPYFFGFNCERILSPPLLRIDGCPTPISEQVGFELVEYLDLNDGSLNDFLLISCPGPYLVTPRICGDCTLLGSNVKPDFWID
ncbi:DUF4249 domain-containing protein [Maribacter algarum]|uniref:DUF4249 domain-containing protein n=1 Tax=Maribacter algarum (ex Zhang et al. 2020) TaxID=2578118 RepID=A0A5S3PQT5_9FLAO|nr:DUF4249 domain-containing protein [Maribacter algarum]TMM57107.1 DUF4249 domain-containing protein [Maribacter algarum]